MIQLLGAHHKSPFVLCLRQPNKAPYCFQKSSESLERVLCNLNQTYSYLMDNTNLSTQRQRHAFLKQKALTYAYTLTVLCAFRSSLCVFLPENNESMSVSVCMCHIASLIDYSYLFAIAFYIFRILYYQLVTSLHFGAWWHFLALCYTPFECILNLLLCCPIHQVHDVCMCLSRHLLNPPHVFYV